MSGLKQTHSIAVMVLYQIQISNVCPNEPIPRENSFSILIYLMLPQMLRYQYVLPLKVLAMAVSNLNHDLNSTFNFSEKSSNARKYLSIMATMYVCT